MIYTQQHSWILVFLAMVMAYAPMTMHASYATTKKLASLTHHTGTFIQQNPLKTIAILAALAGAGYLAANVVHTYQHLEQPRRQLTLARILVNGLTEENICQGMACITPQHRREVLRNYAQVLLEIERSSQTSFNQIQGLPRSWQARRLAGQWERFLQRQVGPVVASLETIYGNTYITYEKNLLYGMEAVGLARTPGALREYLGIDAGTSYRNASGALEQRQAALVRSLHREFDPATRAAIDSDLRKGRQIGYFITPLLRHALYGAYCDGQASYDQLRTFGQEAFPELLGTPAQAQSSDPLARIMFQRINNWSSLHE